VDSVRSLGKRIRAARKARSLSLRLLAQASGVSRSMLSAVERGAKSPTIALLAGIAEGLDLPLSSLLDARSTAPLRAEVIRARRQRAIRDANGIERRSLSRLRQRSGVEFVRYTLPAHTASGVFAPHRPGTLEHIHIGRGNVEIRFGVRRVMLGEGDTLLYEACVAHGFKNSSNGAAVLYLIIERR
jgi:transcriptional regulator with XRE-family HTH domain